MTFLFGAVLIGLIMWMESSIDPILLKPADLGRQFS